MNTVWSSPVTSNNKNAVSMFDDCTWSNEASSPLGPLGLTVGGNAGGGIFTPANIVAGTDAGRIGVIPLGLGTSSNATAQAYVFSDCLRAYAGQIGTLTIQGSTYVPTISDNTNQYAIEIGYRGTTASNAPSSDSMVLMYQQSSSTFWQAYASVGGVATQNVSAITVTSGWWDWKLVLTAAGLQVYVALSGTALQPVGTLITTNLPSTNSHYCSFTQIIYRTQTFALQRMMQIDWIQYDGTGFTR